jgi:hypothetical protein
MEKEPVCISAVKLANSNSTYYNSEPRKNANNSSFCTETLSYTHISRQVLGRSRFRRHGQIISSTRPLYKFKQNQVKKQVISMYNNKATENRR